MKNLKASRHNLLLIIISYLAFISLGLPDGLLGVCWPFISERHSMPLGSLGILLIGFVAGYLSTSSTTGKILSWIPLGMLLAISCGLTGLSLLAFAYSSHWFLIIIASYFLGCGGGAIDTAINVFAASKFSASVVNWLHAFYGVGATSGPVIITWMLTNDQGWYNGYISVAAVQIVLALVFLLTFKYWKLSSEQEPEQHSGSWTEASRLPFVWITILIFFLYTGLEIGVGQWIFTILTESRNVPAEKAGLWTSAYWGSLTVGRILFGFILTRLRVHTVLLGAFAGVIIGALLLAVNQNHLLSLTGLLLIGFSNAPIFPCLISITPKRVGEKHSANIIGFQISAAMIGGAVLPGLAGVLTNSFGWEIIPLTYLIQAILLLSLYLISSQLYRNLKPASVGISKQDAGLSE
ncbi:MFS transporter [Flavihumibacter sp. R14]|nr:MFS transporter [Flavihumibacter soli]